MYVGSRAVLQGGANLELLRRCGSREKDMPGKLEGTLQGGSVSRLQLAEGVVHVRVA